MSDSDVRTLRRLAEESLDWSSWLRLSHALARSAERDGAAQAALVAGGHVDVSEVFDQLTPSLDLFTAGSRELERVPGGLEWTPDGTGLYGLLDRRTSLERTGLEVAEVDIQTGATRTIVHSDETRELYFNRTHPVMDPRGVYVAFGYADGRGEYAVATAERRTGAIVARVARSREGLEDLAISGANLLACRESRGTRFFQLSSAGTSARSRARRVLRWPEILLADGASFARRLARRVDLHDAGCEDPRGSFPTTHLCHVLPVERRAVVVDHELVRLHDARGEVLAEAPRPAGFLGIPSPSPSGRLLAFAYRSERGDQEPRVDLLDLRTGATRAFPLPEDPVRCAWSPSGRKLIAGVMGGSLALLVAP